MKERKRVQIKFDDPSLTDQSQKDECNISFIIDSYVRKGEPLPSTMSYVDCTSVTDYQNAMYLVAEANSNFEQLPSKVRDEFKTVENYLNFIGKSENVKSSIEKGLIDRNTVPVDILKSLYPDQYLTQVEKDEYMRNKINAGVKVVNSSTPPDVLQQPNEVNANS